MVGKQIGQYRVINRLGRGGMGAVYRAIDETLGREVALKVLDAERDDPEKRFQAEAVAVARLSHPGIVTVYELFQHEGSWVMVMEFVRGETLADLLDRTGPLSMAHAVDLCMQALATLAHAHGSGIVHRDLKPANLMLTETGVVKIVDFGIARLAGTERLTVSGFTMGTPAYMAPEQIQGKEVDGRADLYAVGVVLYRLLAAKLPFAGDTPFTMAHAQVNDPPTPIEVLRPDLPAWIARVMTRALAKAPDQRFQSAMEFHEALASGLNELAQPAPGGRPEPTELMAVARPSAPNTTRAKPSTAVQALLNVRTIAAVTPSTRRAWRVGLAAAVILLAIGMPQWSPPVTPDSTRSGNSTLAVHTNEASMEATQSAESRASTTGAEGVRITTSGTERAAEKTAAPSNAYADAKLLVVDGPRTKYQDVVLHLSHVQVDVKSVDSNVSLATVPFSRVGKVTYVHGRDPLWDSSLAAPTQEINVPGIFGRSRHWLVIQTKTTYTILRLGEESWRDILQTFEARLGGKVDRSPVTRESASKN